MKSVFSVMRARHQELLAKYPNTPEARAYPWTGLENPRPEIIKANKARFNPDEVPFDVDAILKQRPEWEGFEQGWGIDG